jgi:hypothetical protein
LPQLLAQRRGEGPFLRNGEHDLCELRGGSR